MSKCKQKLNRLLLAKEQLKEIYEEIKDGMFSIWNNPAKFIKVLLGLTILSQT